MKKKSYLPLFILSVVLLINSLSSADLMFKMSADKDTLNVGETAVINISAKIKGSKKWADQYNGINVWQLDMVSDSNDVIEATTVTIFEPADLASFIPAYQALNLATDGSVIGLGGGIEPWPFDSQVAVGGWTLMAQVTIKAVGPGVVTYDLIDSGMGGGFYAYLRDDTAFNPPTFDYNLNNINYGGNNNNSINVVSAPNGQAGVSELKTGLYVTTGKGRKNQTFTESTEFDVGKQMVILANVDVNDSPVADATVEIAIDGPETLVVTSDPSDELGVAKAVWKTRNPNKRGVGGTIPGNYTATVANVTAPGYSWDGTPINVSFVLKQQ